MGLGGARRSRPGWAAVVVAVLAVASCGDGTGAQATTPTTSRQAATVPATAAPSTTWASTTSTTVATTSEPPVIDLAGGTAVYSQDGDLHVEGRVDRPARVTVGDIPAETHDDPYAGSTAFAADLTLDTGEHAVEITAVDGAGLENTIHLSVIVDPELEMELGYLEEVDPAAPTLVVDYVEFLTADEAVRAAVEDGVIAAGEDLPNGFYLRNRDPRLRTLSLRDPGVIVLQACFPHPAPCVTEHSVGVDLWFELLADPELAEDELGWSWYGYAELPYWFTIQDGYVVHIREQYLP